MFYFLFNLAWVNALMRLVYYYGKDAINSGLEKTNKDVKFNIGILKFIEGVTSSYFLIKLLRNDMGVRLRKYPRTNWCLHYFFILMRLVVICFCVLYLIPHWAGIEERIFLILEKNEEYKIDLQTKHSLFNQYLMMTFWTLIIIPSILLIIFIIVYMIVSLTCRPFWLYRKEIRSALHTLYRKFVRDFITGYSRHYVLLDKITLEASSFTDTNLEDDVNNDDAINRSKCEHYTKSEILLNVNGVVGDMNRRLEKFKSKFAGELVKDKKYPF